MEIREYDMQELDNIQKSILGSMLNDNDIIDDVVTIITPECYTSQKNRMIHEAISVLHEDDTSADYYTVNEYLQQQGKVDQAGGVVYLIELQNFVVHAANAIAHAHILKQHFMRRRLLSSLETALVKAKKNDGLVLEQIGALQIDLDALTSKRPGLDGIVSADTDEVFDTLVESRYREKPQLVGIASGITQFDIRTHGFHPGWEYLIGAPTGVGKTSFVLNCAHHAVTRGQRRVCIFSLEMQEQRLKFRLRAMHTNVNHQHLEYGTMTDAEYERYHQRVKEVSGLKNLIVCENPILTVNQLCAITRKQHRTSPLDLVIVDYLQLLEWDGTPSESRYLQIASQNKRIMALAKNLNIPIIVVTQLNEEGHARESRNLEHDADFFMVLAPMDVEAPIDEYPLKGIINKSREGDYRPVFINFNMLTQKMTDCSIEKYAMEGVSYGER